MTRILRFAAFALLAVSLAAPSFAAGARGTADFRQLVAFGDSFGAGVSNVGLNIKHQRYSWPAVLARQVGLDTDCVTDGPNCFQIPYISEPGILPELYLTSLIPPSIALKPGLGAPINSGLARPYNNLSIDGAEINDVLNLDLDGNEALTGPLVLRGQGQAIDQALRLNPTFVVMWLGGDDAFNGVQGGKPSLMTPLADFTASYNTVLDRLVAGAPNAGIVVGNLPGDLRGIPFLTLVPSYLVNASGQPVLDPAGNRIPLIADLGDGTFGPLPAGSVVLLTSRDLIASGYGIPAPLKPLIPLPNVGKPLPNEAVLTPTELAAIAQRITEYNAAIASAAAARNIPVVDINAFFNRAKQGLQVGPMTLGLSYITGGLISLDAFHLTDVGYTLFANEYIKTINTAYGTHIPLAGIGQLLQNNDATLFSSSAIPTFEPSAAAALHMMSEPVKAQVRHRATH